MIYLMALWTQVCSSVLYYGMKLASTSILKGLKGKVIPVQTECRAQRVPRGWCVRISRQSVHESGEILCRTRRSPLSSRKYSWFSFPLGAESTPVPEGRVGDLL